MTTFGRNDVSISMNDNCLGILFYDDPENMSLLKYFDKDASS